MTVSYVVAFIGGVIALLSPCSAMVIPMFAASASGSKHSLYKAMAWFGVGLLLSLIPVGIGALALSSFFAVYRRGISMVLGVGMMLLGVVLLGGVHLRVPDLAGPIQRLMGTRLGLAPALVMGVVAGLGSTACVGPILGAILTLAGSQGGWAVVGLLIAYALGLMAPLILFVWMYLRYETRIASTIQSKSLKLFGYELPIATVASGLLLMSVGYVFVRYQGSLGFSSVFTRSGWMNRVFDFQDMLLIGQ